MVVVVTEGGRGVVGPLSLEKSNILPVVHKIHLQTLVWSAYFLECLIFYPSFTRSTASSIPEKIPQKLRGILRGLRIIKKTTADFKLKKFEKDVKLSYYRGPAIS